MFDDDSHRSGALAGASGRARFVRIAGGAWLAGLIALILVGCKEPAPDGPPIVSAPPPPDVEFEDQLALLEAIEDGSFADQVELSESLEVLAVPPPGRIDFVRGTEVPADQEDELALVAEQLMENDRLQLDLIGCSDPSGSRQLNRRISQQRAESVASRLETLGVRREQLDRVEGLGESCELQERAVRMIPKLREAVDENA